MSTLYNRIKKNPYAQISKSVLRCPQLSLKGKGLFSQIAAMHTDWNIKVSQLVKQSKDGKAAIYAALKELKEAGYCRMDKRQDGQVDYYITDMPFDWVEKPVTDNRNQEEEPVTEKAYYRKSLTPIIGVIKETISDNETIVPKETRDISKDRVNEIFSEIYAEKSSFGEDVDFFTNPYKIILTLLERNEILYPSEDFVRMMFEWVFYRKQKYKNEWSSMTEAAGFLYKISEMSSNEEHAKATIRNAISHGWKNIYQLETTKGKNEEAIKEAGEILDDYHSEGK